MTLRHSVCPLDCPSACALDVEVDPAGRIGRIHGAREHPHTRGVVCAKVARYGECVHDGARLTVPLRRIGDRGDGRFAPIGWDEALDEVAGRLTDCAREYGAESVWPYQYAGTMGLVMRNSVERLRNVMGWSRQLGTICSTAGNAGWLAGTGAKLGTDMREILDSELIVIWGTNAVATQIQLMTLVTEARRRGARLVVVDPYRNATAAKADQHLMLRPGTDAALACAVMHVLLAEGLADRDYLARLTDFGADVEAHLASRTPAWAAAVTGLAEADIVAFARSYGATRKSYIRLGFGFTRQRNGAVAAHAVSCLPAITGAWMVAGGGALLNASGCFAQLRTELLSGADVARPGVRALDMSRIGAILSGDTADLKGGPPVRAMLIQNTNPMVVAPEHARVRAGFTREDLFVCVHEQRMTETARMADIVLPATTFLEHDDLYASYGTSFLQVARAVIAPVGEARNNHQVIQGLAERLGAEHPGFALTPWQLIEATLDASGLPGADELLERRWLDLSPGFAATHFTNGFGHPDSRFHFKPGWSNPALPAMPDHYDAIESADAQHPFRLVTAPAHNFLNSSFNHAPGSRRLEERPTLLAHPADLADLGIADGGEVRVGNGRGSLRLMAKAFAGLSRGVVIAEGLWANADFADGAGINLLTSADAIPPDGGAPFHDTRVWLAAADR